ncbi:MAG: hypothetical protein WCL34_12885 [Methylococcaceae bacterium]
MFPLAFDFAFYQHESSENTRWNVGATAKRGRSELQAARLFAWRGGER